MVGLLCVRACFHLPACPLGMQDVILPVMFSPHKYAQSPNLGGPSRERKFLAVFKGAIGGAAGRVEGSARWEAGVGGCSGSGWFRVAAFVINDALTMLAGTGWHVPSRPPHLPACASHPHRARPARQPAL